MVYSGGPGFLDVDWLRYIAEVVASRVLRGPPASGRIRKSLTLCLVSWRFLSKVLGKGCAAADRCTLFKLPGSF